ncbi:hypothetical protein [Viridibacillus arvi]|uniref:Uncharacterized protein n=1 Tax=Viridibacillus arvi TaxID=263475 RepID=A0A0M0LEX0_9BACL|nr:hypothetical protein [Viridibacillus arvi]KOO49491.1 hypothetical protein AMD00_14125 [Viridibacillus arvi]
MKSAYPFIAQSSRTHSQYGFVAPLNHKTQKYLVEVELEEILNVILVEMDYEKFTTVLNVVEIPFIETFKKQVIEVNLINIEDNIVQDNIITTKLLDLQSVFLVTEQEVASIRHENLDYKIPSIVATEYMLQRFKYQVPVIEVTGQDKRNLSHRQIILEKTLIITDDFNSENINKSVLNIYNSYKQQHFPLQINVVDLDKLLEATLDVQILGLDHYSTENKIDVYKQQEIKSMSRKLINIIVKRNNNYTKKIVLDGVSYQEEKTAQREVVMNGNRIYVDVATTEKVIKIIEEKEALSSSELFVNANPQENEKTSSQKMINTVLNDYEGQTSQMKIDVMNCNVDDYTSETLFDLAVISNDTKNANPREIEAKEFKIVSYSNDGNLINLGILDLSPVLHSENEYEVNKIDCELENAINNLKVDIVNLDDQQEAALDTQLIKLDQYSVNMVLNTKLEEKIKNTVRQFFEVNLNDIDNYTKSEVILRAYSFYLECKIAADKIFECIKKTEDNSILFELIIEGDRNSKDKAIQEELVIMSNEIISDSSIVGKTISIERIEVGFFTIESYLNAVQQKNENTSSESTANVVVSNYDGQITETAMGTSVHITDAYQNDTTFNSVVSSIDTQTTNQSVLETSEMNVNVYSNDSDVIESDVVKLVLSSNSINVYQGIEIDGMFGKAVNEILSDIVELQGQQEATLDTQIIGLDVINATEQPIEAIDENLGVMKSDKKIVDIDVALKDTQIKNQSILESNDSDVIESDVVKLVSSCNSINVYQGVEIDGKFGETSNGILSDIVELQGQEGAALDTQIIGLDEINTTEQPIEAIDENLNVMKSDKVIVDINVALKDIKIKNQSILESNEMNIEIYSNESDVIESKIVKLASSSKSINVYQGVEIEGAFGNAASEIFSDIIELQGQQEAALDTQIIGLDVINATEQSIEAIDNNMGVIRSDKVIVDIDLLESNSSSIILQNILGELIKEQLVVPKNLYIIANLKESDIAYYVTELLASKNKVDSFGSIATFAVIEETQGTYTPLNILTAEGYLKDTYVAPRIIDVLNQLDENINSVTMIDSIENLLEKVRSEKTLNTSLFITESLEVKNDIFALIMESDYIVLRESEIDVDAVDSVNFELTEAKKKKKIWLIPARANWYSKWFTKKTR